MQSVTLSSPSRLHFGLFSVGQQVEREFGGMGLMIEAPRTEIRVRGAKKFAIAGPEASQCLATLENWLPRMQPFLGTSPHLSAPVRSVDDLPLEIEIQKLPPRHRGLGSGTQLAMCSAAAITTYLELPLPNAHELAPATGRGRRSAIGSYGFYSGGLLVDRGTRAGDPIAPLDLRTDFPEHWPVVVVWFKELAGFSGEVERAAFAKLPDTPPSNRQQMIDCVRDQIIPAVMERNYSRFGEALYQFGRNSGLYFQTVQGGPYNGTAVESLVASIRELGVPAAGQTSWGPGVFAIAETTGQAQHIQEELFARHGDAIEIIVTHADNQGVRQSAVGPSQRREGQL